MTVEPLPSYFQNYSLRVPELRIKTDIPPVPYKQFTAVYNEQVLAKEAQYMCFYFRFFLIHTFFCGEVVRIWGRTEVIHIAVWYSYIMNDFFFISSFLFQYEDDFRQELCGGGGYQ